VSSRFQRLELDATNPPAPKAAAASAAPAAAMETHDAAHWMRVAGQYRRQGLFEAALRHYSRAVEMDRALVPGWVGQVRMLVALEEFPEAELWARKALELFRGQADLTAGRAQALCRAGDIKQAQGICDAAIQQPGQSPYPWLVRGDLMLALADSVEEHCFDKAVQLSGDWLTLIEIAEIYLYYHRPAKAQTRCQQALAKASDQPYCWYLQGMSQSASGFHDAARLSFKHCLDLDPQHAGARAAMESGGGWLRRLLGR
jgi:tetratricopeptide (TPR) repeat protein